MKELRHSELRLKDKESRTITGTAIVFNSQSVVLGSNSRRFREVVKPSAVTQELINNSDILMLYNHSNVTGVLARSKKGKGTLKIMVDSTGVRYEFEAPKTSLGNDMLESLRRGDITSSSFAFTVNEDGQKWEKTSDGYYLRTITKFGGLYDFSIVPTPAYSETTADVRGLEKLIGSGMGSDFKNYLEAMKKKYLKQQ